MSLSTDLMRLHVNPKVTAECQKQVSLNCTTASSSEGLSIIQMHWYLKETSLCSVNTEGNITYSNPQKNFRCEYTHGQLSLIIEEVQPLESGDTSPYKCKITSNKGAAHGTTIVELQGKSPLSIFMTDVQNRLASSLYLLLLNSCCSAQVFLLT